MENENQHTYDNGFHPKEVNLQADYKFYNHNLFFRIFSTITVYFTRLWLFFIKRFMGFKIRGKKNRKLAKGMILVSNHIHPLDAFFLISSFYHRKIYATMLQSNLGFGFISKYMRIAAGVPIPSDRRMLRKFNKETAETLKMGENILFYPESALVPYCDHIRPFLPGAFHYAVVNNAPILPCCFTFHKPKGLYKLFRKKPLIRLNVLPPYYLPSDLNNRVQAIKKVTEDVHKIMNDFFVANSDYFYKDGQMLSKS